MISKFLIFDNLCGGLLSFNNFKQSPVYLSLCFYNHKNTKIQYLHSSPYHFFAGIILNHCVGQKSSLQC